MYQFSSACLNDLLKKETKFRNRFRLIPSVLYTPRLCRAEACRKKAMEQKSPADRCGGMNPIRCHVRKISHIAFYTSGEKGGKENSCIGAISVCTHR